MNGGADDRLGTANPGLSLSLADRHAQKLSRPDRLDRIGVEARSLVGKSVRVRQPSAGSDQDPFWGQAGFCIWYQQLQQGTYQLPGPDARQTHESVELTRSQLSLILDGIDLASVRQRASFQRSPQPEVDLPTLR